MHFSKLAIYPISLILFEEGGDSGDSIGTDVVYGIQDDGAGAADQQTDPIDIAAAFDADIAKGGKYADVFNQRVSSIVQKRIGDSKSMQQRYDAQQPLIDALMTKYGAKDIEQLQQAIDEDDSFYEEAAFNNGMSVEQYKRFAKMERENAAFHSQIAQQEAQRGAEQTQARWFAEAQALRESFPDFDLNTEIQSNPQFADNLKRGLSVVDSYRLTHFDDLIGNAQRGAAQIAQQRAAASARQNAARPAENGASVRQAQRVISDPNNMSSAQILDAIERARRGEKIRF